MPSDAPGSATEKPGPHDAPAGDEDAGGEQDDEAVPDGGDPQDAGDGDGPREGGAPEDSDDEEGDAPDPALVSQIIERLDQIKVLTLT